MANGDIGDNGDNGNNGGNGDGDGDVSIVDHGRLF